MKKKRYYSPRKEGFGHIVAQAYAVILIQWAVIAALVGYIITR